MKAFLLFLATVVILMAVAMPDHFRIAVHATEYWISRTVAAVF